MTVRAFFGTERGMMSGLREDIHLFGSIDPCARTHSSQTEPQKGKLFGRTAMILSVPGGKSGRNRFEIGPPRCGIARALQVYTLRTSSEPCHCQFRAHNGDSWRIEPNIETYPLLLLSPSGPPHFSLPSSIPLHRLDIITKIFEARRDENASLAALSRAAMSRATGRFLRDYSRRGTNERQGETWNRIHEIGAPSYKLFSPRNLGTHALRLTEKKYFEHLHRYITSCGWSRQATDLAMANDNGPWNVFLRQKHKHDWQQSSNLIFATHNFDKFVAFKVLL